MVYSWTCGGPTDRPGFKINTASEIKKKNGPGIVSQDRFHKSNEPKKSIWLKYTNLDIHTDVLAHLPPSMTNNSSYVNAVTYSPKVGSNYTKMNENCTLAPISDSALDAIPSCMDAHGWQKIKDVGQVATIVFDIVADYDNAYLENTYFIIHKIWK